MRVNATTHPNARVFLNNTEISQNCREADDVEGWATIYRVNTEGYRYLTWPSCGHRERILGCLCENFVNEAVTARVEGAVRIQLP